MPHRFHRWLLLAAFATLAAHQLAAAPPDVLRELTAKAKAGDAESQFRLGQHCLLNNIVTLMDPAQAEDWFRQAARQNHLGAILALVDLYAMFPEQATNDADVADLLARAADMGRTAASVRLGQLLWTGGRNLKADRAAAYRRLRDGALRGNETAIIFLVEKALDDGAVKRDPEAARKILEWGVLHGSVVAEMHLLVFSEKNRRLESMVRVTRKIEKLAKDADAHAMTVLGRALETGLASVANSSDETLNGRFNQAREAYLAAAQRGDPEGQVRLGLLALRRGLDTPPDPKLARQCFELAAAERHPLAQFNLAMLMLGDAKPADPVRVRELLENASVRYPAASFSLGMMYS